MPPETQGLVVIDGHICESSWIANKVTVGRYGADFNVIQDAINYCDAIGGEWTILIYPRGEAGAAVYDESDITPNGGASITLKGMGEGRVRIVPTAAPTLATIVSAHNLQIENIIIGVPDATRPALRVTSGIFGATRGSITGVGAGDAIQQVGGNIELKDCYVPAGDIDLSTGACTLEVTNSEINAPIDTAGAFAHQMVLHRVDMGSNDINSAATGATTLEARHCSNISTITNAGTGEFNIRNSDIGELVTATGIIRLRNCQYHAITRTGTGNIVDESPWLSDTPWHVVKWTWQAALANSQVAVRGAPIDGGSGQVLLEVTLNAAGQEAVENLPEAGGANDNSFTPARTPRMITQFMWDRSGANQFVFFGLRETLGDAYPASPEHSAGFHYNSATGFVARSSDGVDDEDTVCTTPGHGAIVQLEVIVFGGHSVEFRIDGVLVATHTTRVPTATIDWQHLLYTDGGGAATDVDVEIRNGGVQECPS